MIYFATPSTDGIRAAMAAPGPLGAIITPRSRNRVPPAPVRWCADNGCFGKHYVGDAGWLAWLAAQSRHADRCVFAAAPDVVGDAPATLERSRPHLQRLRDLGYRPALVAQDGLERLPVPWESIDALFIGGSTSWKLGWGARALMAEAKARGKWLHIGRVNTEQRMRMARFVEADSIDGTYLRFGPDVNLPRLLRFMATVLNNEPLPMPLEVR